MLSAKEAKEITLKYSSPRKESIAILIESFWLGMKISHVAKRGWSYISVSSLSNKMVEKLKQKGYSVKYDNDAQILIYW